MIDNNKKNSIKPKKTNKQNQRSLDLGWFGESSLPAQLLFSTCHQEEVTAPMKAEATVKTFSQKIAFFLLLPPPKKKDHCQGREKKEALNLIEPQADKMSKNLPLNGSFPYCLLHRGLSSLIGCARASEVMTHS